MKKQKGYSWLHEGLGVQKTPYYGKGIFALKNIKKGTVLAIFGGYVMTLKEEKKLSRSIRDLAHQIHSQFVIGIKDKKEKQLVDNFNHSCEPNAGFKGQIFLVAMRNIKKGEEVTFDYAMVLSDDSNQEPYKLRCLCGSKKCRKTIDTEGWRTPALQKKYKGYFQYYLSEKIDEEKRKKLARLKKTK